MSSNEIKKCACKDNLENDEKLMCIYHFELKYPNAFLSKSLKEKKESIKIIRR